MEEQPWLPDFGSWVAIAVEHWLRKVGQDWLCVQWYKLLTAYLDATINNISYQNQYPE